MDPQMAQYIAKSGRDPRKGVERTLKQRQNKLLDVVGPLAKICNIIEEAMSNSSPVDLNILRGWVQRAFCFIFNANTALSMERRRVILLRIDPKLLEMASTEAGPETNGLLFGESFIKNLEKFVNTFMALNKAQTPIKTVFNRSVLVRAEKDQQQKQNAYKQDTVFGNPITVGQFNITPDGCSINQNVQTIVQNTEVPLTAIYVALYNYQARTVEELSIRTGEKMRILNADHSSWWKARLMNTHGKSEGYVPANYVAPVCSIHSKLWFFQDMKRLEAERLLTLPGTQTGTFLVRESESQKGDYSLSVLMDTTVKHYRIRKLDNGGFYITPKNKFQSMTDLVDYYSKKGDGLCCKLKTPCLKREIPLPPDLCYGTADHWEIDRNSLKFLKKLGHGQFGEVWEGLWNDTISVAIKTLKTGSMNPQDFLREAQIMKNLRHPKLIQLYAVCTLEEPVYIITELMRHGSLHSYLQNDNGATIKIPQQVDMAAQVASGMAYLETQNYIHRDLAARNVLVGENSVYKVADFGLARVFEDDDVYEARSETKLPLKWTAPEAIRYNKFTVKSDVWSFGILIFEIVTFGKMPYPGITGKQALEKLEQGYRIPKPLNCPLDLYNIMLECWNAKPEERPTFETLQWRLEDFFETESSSYLDASAFGR
ncbi:tyrosine-protein kinase FRK [Rhinophrynus dorsalis]